MKKLNNKGFTMVEVMIAAVLGCFILAAVATLGVEYSTKRRHDNIHRIFQKDIELALDYIGNGYYDTTLNIKRLGIKDIFGVPYTGSYSGAERHSIYSTPDIGTENYLSLQDKLDGTGQKEYAVFYVGKNAAGEESLVYGFNDFVNTKTTPPSFSSTAKYNWRILIPSNQEKRFFDDIQLQVDNPDAGGGTGSATAVQNRRVRIVLRRNANPPVFVEGVKTFATNIGIGSVP